MREIKFRAWDKVNDIMFKANNFTFGTDGGTILKDNIKLIFPLDVELMQYTGLKDKNGVEIYESDLLKLSFYEEYSNNCVTVDYDSEVIIKVKWNNDGFWEFCEKDSTWYIPNTLDDYCNIEVIGNIYENKDLLEGN